MKLEFDRLKCVKMLERSGLCYDHAEGIVSTLTETALTNVYSTMEINAMLSESVERVFREFHEKMRHQDEKMQRQDELMRRQDEKKDEQMRRQNEQLDFRFEKRLEANLAEARFARRWMSGLVVTCTLALAGYLSALIHFTH